jgi:NRAMP (natural resistance-associated macrophage protein)-like metal ion transporter
MAADEVRWYNKANRMGKLKMFWKSLGPGLITGAADDDPSGIATYSIAGAKFGLATLWTVIVTLPFMIVIQRMCGRIGMISGRGLAGNMKKHYPTWILVIITSVILIANIINIGADISAMAASIDLLVPLSPLLLCAIISGTIILLLIVMTYRQIAHYLKWIAIVLFAYVFAAFLVGQPWKEVLYRAVVPPWRWDKEYISLIVAIFGTTISPYLFFWQASEEVEEERIRQDLAPGTMMPDIKPKNRAKHRIRNEIGAMYKDVYYGMIFSNLITFFIIILSSSTLFTHGYRNVSDIGQIAQLLRPIAGQYADLLFLVGIVAAGTLAIPVLAGSAAYALAEVFGWHDGFENHFGKAKQFYIVIILATLLGLAIPALHIDPVNILYYTAVVFGIISPILIALIIHMANNPKIMGTYTSRLSSNILAYTLLIIMSASVVAMFFL